MIRKIILENYMSHAHTVIEPAAGLTVLIGPNNCGKSAVVAALQTLARNTSGDFMVRHDAKVASVTVETDDGHTLIWRRKANGSPSYVINGREVNRLGKGGVPEDLHDLLKLPLVRLNEDNTPFEVHFGEQKKPIFLFDESESRAAAFFSASSDAGRLLEIQDLHRAKVRDRKRDRTRLSGEIARLDNELQCLAPLNDVSPKVDRAETEFATIADEIAAIHTLEKTIAAIETMKLRAVFCQVMANASEKLIAPPDQQDEPALDQVIRSIVEQTRRRDYSHGIATKLEGISAPPELVDPEPLAQSIAAINRISQNAKYTTAQRSALIALRDAPQLEDPKPLSDALAAISSAARRIASFRSRVESLCTLGDLPTLNDWTGIEQTIESIALAEKNMCDLQITRQTCAQRLSDVEEEIKSWAQANPNCPVCGGMISADQLLHDGGRRHV